MFLTILNTFINKLRTKQFKKPGNLFLANLAIADLLKATFNLPMTIGSSFEQKWIFGKIGNFKFSHFIKYYNENLIYFCC